jgi:hypothetical protein
MGAKAKKSIPEPILKRAEEDDLPDGKAGFRIEEEQSKLEI